MFLEGITARRNSVFAYRVVLYICQALKITEDEAAQRRFGCSNVRFHVRVKIKFCANEISFEMIVIYYELVFYS